MHGRPIFSSSLIWTVLSSMIREPASQARSTILGHLRLRPGGGADGRAGDAIVKPHREISAAAVGCGSHQRRAGRSKIAA